MAQAFCTKCGAPRGEGTAFCSRCGASFAQSPSLGRPPVPAPPRPPAPLVSTPTFTAPPLAAPPAPGTAAPGTAAPVPLDTHDTLSRIRSAALPLILTGFMLYIDSITHSGPLPQIGVGLLVTAAVLFGGQILDRIGLRAAVEQIPSKLRPILLALPPLIWFAVRAKGTSGAGVPVAIVGIGLVSVITLFGHAIDRRLARFYERRNQVLPRGLRAVLTLVAPTLVSFAVIHGSLRALPVLFGGTTSSSAGASGRTSLFVIGTLLSGILAFLLLREQET